MAGCVVRCIVWQKLGVVVFCVVGLPPPASRIIITCFRYVGEDLGANMGGLINMGDAKCPHQVIRPFLTKELFLPGPRPSLALGYVVRDPGVRNCQKPEIAI